VKSRYISRCTVVPAREETVFIRSLTIERFRGLERLEWQPPGRVNCLIGPGDAGKSTIRAELAAARGAPDAGAIAREALASPSEWDTR
jgi:ABC-type hemin transport system ATPase subunit